MNNPPPKTLHEARKQGLNNYFNGTSCSKGHVDFRDSQHRCKECLRLDSKRRRSDPEYLARERIAKNVNRRERYSHDTVYRQELLDKQRAVREQSPEIHREKNRRRYADPVKRASILAGQKKRYQALSDDVEFVAKERERKRRHMSEKWANDPEHRRYSYQYRKDRAARDPNYKLANALRTRLHRAINGPTQGLAVKLLGCSVDVARKHIERQFLPGMSWANYGYDTWHIDHIKALSTFDLTDPDQLARACHYKNLRPMWAFDNMSKGAKHHNDLFGPI